MLKAPEKPVRNLPKYNIGTLTANIKRSQPRNIGRERNTMDHFLPYLGSRIPVKGPAVNAPKFRRAATQLCCSTLRMRSPSKSSPQSWGESWGRVGAGHDRTVPRPKEPIVATKVAKNWFCFLYFPSVFSLYMLSYH